MSSDIRNLRLANDYKEMCNMQGEIVSWKAVKGKPPYVEEYLLNISIKSPISTKPAFRNKHQVSVTLPPAYPKDRPVITMLSKPKIAHPNWWDGGLWCPGSHNIRESLGTLIRRMLATIQFDPDYADPDSAADKSVLDWYKSQLNSGLLPFDRTTLPDPKGHMRIKKKKTFIIK